MAKLFVLKMSPHSTYDVVPELLAAFFVNRFVADNGELVGPRRHENKDGVALAGLVHAQPLEFFLRDDQWIGI